jgi:hypothetical protein
MGGLCDLRLTITENFNPKNQQIKILSGLLHNERAGG